MKQHPFARYPYTYQPTPPGYVGPQWAAPTFDAAAHRPAKGMSGCLVVLLIATGAVAAVFFALIVIAIALVPDGRSDDPQAKRGEPSTGDDDDDDGDADAGMPSETHGVDPTTVPGSKYDAKAKKEYATGWCYDVTVGDEARSFYTTDYRNGGSARRLRGRAAVVHLRILSSELTWTPRRAADVDRAALLTARFVTDQATRAGVTDLDYAPIVWTLRTSFRPPKLVTRGRHLLSAEQARELVAQALRESEGSLGMPMKNVLAGLRKAGYRDVAFVVHLPLGTDAREFAYPASSGDDDVDVAIVFADHALGDVAWITTHEIMHLFGADDLYPLVHDARDVNDVMRARCAGFAETRIGDVTAWAIGWRDARPARSFFQLPE